MVGELLLQYKYVIMVPLTLVAQPIVGMTAGLFARLGYLEVVPVYLIVLCTALVGDAGWYWVGYHYGERFARRFGHWFSITPAHITQVKKIFHQYHAPILFISKIVNGLGFAIAVLFTAGLTRVPFKRYMLFNLIGESIWSGVVVAVGYYFGEAYLQVHDVLGRVTLITISALVLLLMIGFGRYFRKRIVAKIE